MLLYLKPIIRNALKNKSITILNIFGLSVGLVCSIFLIFWVLHESSYDSFVKDKDKIYRVIIEGNINGEYQYIASCMNGLGPESKNLYPEVENYVRLSGIPKNSLLKSIDNKFSRADGYSADSTFFAFFPFKAIEGNLSASLAIRNNIVVVKSLANKFFGNNSALGRQLIFDKQAYTISAVIDNVPSNSHLQFQFLIPTLNKSEFWHEDKWGSDNSMTYLKLNNTDKIDFLNKKITELIYSKNNIWKDININLSLQNISDIPYNNDFKWDYAGKTSKRNIYALSGIAILIMLIACINFTNMFISSVLKRKKSIGVKLVTGASKISIVREYITEVLLYVSISFVFILLLLELLNPYFNFLTESIITISFLSLRFIVISIPLIIVTSLLAGLIPGIYLSRFNPIEVMKSQPSSKANKRNIQKVLVTAQFVIATILVFSVVIIYKQVDFLQSKDLGFDKENILYVHTIGNLRDKSQKELLKNELQKSKNISKIAYIGEIPTVWNNGLPITKEPNKENILSAEEIRVDEDYFDLMNVKFVEGDNIFRNSSASSNFCIINEKLVESLNLSAPYIDQAIYRGVVSDKISGHYNSFIVKGVIKNINSKSLAQPVGPCIYFNRNDWDEKGLLLFKVNTNYSNAIEDIKTYWTKEFPDMPFEYWFLDQTYDRLYKSEIKAGEIISWFTVLALILTSLGLLAMTYLMADQRTKEIGIRKVIGTKVFEILFILVKDFVRNVVYAFIIASPIAYYVMNSWLDNYAYKTTISWWIFLLVGLIMLILAVLATSWQALKTATANPVESLKYE